MSSKSSPSPSPSASPQAPRDVESQAQKRTSYTACFVDDTSTLAFFSQFLLCLLLGIALAGALGALSGFLSMIIGQAILRTTHHSGYDVPLSSSMKVGAAGGAVVTGVAIIVFTMADRLWNPRSQDDIMRPNPVMQFVRIGLGVAFSAASGAAGVGLMHTYEPGLVCLDAVHAARAGALGATILASPIALFAVFQFVVMCCALTIAL